MKFWRSFLSFRLAWKFKFINSSSGVHVLKNLYIIIFSDGRTSSNPWASCWRVFLRSRFRIGHVRIVSCTHNCSWYQLCTSLHCNISLSFCSFSYIEVCFLRLKLYIDDVIVKKIPMEKESSNSMDGTINFDSYNSKIEKYFNIYITKHLK